VNRATCCTLPESIVPPACMTPLGDEPLAVVAAITGSPLGPTTPGICFPVVTVPKPPTGSFLALLSVLAHPPPKPANNANVAAVRFISPPSGRAPTTVSRDPFASNNFSTISLWNFGQSRNNRHSHPKDQCRLKVAKPSELFQTGRLGIYCNFDQNAFPQGISVVTEMLQRRHAWLVTLGMRDRLSVTPSNGVIPANGRSIKVGTD